MMREIFDRHGCDKGRCHGYERVYEPAFEDIRQEPLRLLEIGILKGASLASWVDYFPNATIVGIDTFQRKPPDSIPILQHPRVKWHKHDSTKPLDLGYFDIIIDDGLHSPTAQRKTFERFGSRAKQYFIEDVWAFDHMTEKEQEHKWIKSQGYTLEDYNKLKGVLPLNAKFHDLRARHQPDSFIISVTQ